MRIVGFVMTNQEYADSLRELADAIEVIPESAELDRKGISLLISVQTPEKMAEKIKTIGGTFEKSGDDTWFNMTRSIGIHKIQVFARRENVCKKVTVVREVEEWECPDSILEQS